jgi:hypothetical protein
MKRELTRHHLRLVTHRAYDPLYAGPGKCVVERSLEVYAPEEGSTDALQCSDAHESAIPDRARPDCVNPLREEPHPAAIGAVRRFGVVGLVTCALTSSALRWWKSLSH